MFAALIGILASRNRLLGNNFFLRGTANDIFAPDVADFPVQLEDDSAQFNAIFAPGIGSFPLLVKDDSPQFNAIFAPLPRSVPGQIESSQNTLYAMNVPTVPMQALGSASIYQPEPALFTMSLAPGP